MSPRPCEDGPGGQFDIRAARGGMVEVVANMDDGHKVGYMVTPVTARDIADRLYDAANWAEGRRFEASS